MRNSPGGREPHKHDGRPHDHDVRDPVLDVPARRRQLDRRAGHDRAAVETYACRNGTTLHIVGGRWMVADAVHDGTLSDPAFFGPDKLRTWCLEGLR